MIEHGQYLRAASYTAAGIIAGLMAVHVARGRVCGEPGTVVRRGGDGWSGSVARLVVEQGVRRQLAWRSRSAR